MADRHLLSTRFPPPIGSSPSYYQRRATFADRVLITRSVLQALRAGQPWRYELWELLRAWLNPFLQATWYEPPTSGQHRE